MFISVLFLISLTAGKRLRNAVNKSRFYPVMLDTKKIGVTVFVATILYIIKKLQKPKQHLPWF